MKRSRCSVRWPPKTDAFWPADRASFRPWRSAWRGPSHLVDINGVAGLDKIAVRDGRLSIGACVRHAAFHKPVVEGPLGNLLSFVVRHIAHYPIRTRGTFCGSLAHADPSSEWCLIAATLGATMVARSTRGTRELAADDFFDWAMTTNLAEDELLVEAHLAAACRRYPLRLLRIQPARRRLCHRDGAGDLSACGWRHRRCACRAWAAPKGARAASRKPKRHSTARRRRRKSFAAAAEAAAAAVDPLEDLQANAKYRRDLVRTVTRRALERAAA